MITNVVTLYGKRGAGHELVLGPEDGHEIILWTRGKISRNAADQLHARLGAKELIEIVRSSGGGLILRLESNRPASIKVVGVDGYRPAARFLLLAPGAPAEFKQLADATLPATPGVHALVPVDETSETQLRDLQQGLSYLPSDRELLILNLIRRPSLEARVSEIEEYLKGGNRSKRRVSSSAVEGARPPMLERLKLKQLWWAYAIVALVAMLAVADYLWAGYFLGGPAAPDTAQGVQPPVEPPSSKPPATPARTSVTPQQELVNAKSDLVSVLYSDASRPAATKLAGAHSMSNNPDGFAWGLLKLYLLKRDFLVATEPAAIDVKAWTATRTILTKHLDVRQTDGMQLVNGLEPAERASLAWASCQAWDLAGLKAYGTTNPALFFSTNSCSELDVAEEKKLAAGGLRELTAWVRAR